MNWYKKAQTQEAQIWQLDKEQHTGPIPNVNFETKNFSEYSKWREKDRKWEQETQKAVSDGRVSLEDAMKKGFRPTEKLTKLPDTLYHVTTAKNAVVASGLKTRDELNMSSGKGLGGGVSDAVSFTESLGTARIIKRALLEARKVSTGELTLSKMIEMAANGEGANRPWLLETFSYWHNGKKNTKDENGNIVYPEVIKDLLNGIEKTFVPIFDKEKMKAEGWTQDEEEPFIFYRKIDYNTLIKDTFSFYKIWAAYREHAGGPEDPLFFGSDILSLANVPEDQIAILKCKSKPGAIGYQMSALGEWRVWSGAALEFVEEVE